MNESIVADWRYLTLKID